MQHTSQRPFARRSKSLRLINIVLVRTYLCYVTCASIKFQRCCCVVLLRECCSSVRLVPVLSKIVVDIPCFSEVRSFTIIFVLLLSALSSKFQSLRNELTSSPPLLSSGPSDSFCQILCIFAPPPPPCTILLLFKSHSS